MRRICACLLLVGHLASLTPALAHPLYPDEPAGFSQLVRHQFSDKTNGGTCNDYYPTGDAVILSDASLTTSPPFFLRDQKQAFASTGGTTIECLFAPQNALFWGFKMRVSNPFGGYNNAANKIGFMMTNRAAGGGALWGMHYYGATNGSRVISVFLQATAVNNCHIPQATGDCSGVSTIFLPNVNGTPVAEGIDHRIEVTMVRSTTEISRDGIIRVVVDGIVRTNLTNVNFPAWQFISIQNNHTWDGQCALRNPSVGPTTPPNDCRTFIDYYDFDDWYASGSQVAGGGGGTSPPPPPPLPPNRPTNLRVQ